MNSWESEREKIIGLGNQSIRKSYYPILKSRLKELERFHQILNHSLDGILIIASPEGIVVDANSAVCRLFNVSLNEVKGKSFEILFDKKPLNDIGKFIHDQDADTLSAYRIERHINGQKVYYEINLNREELDSETIIVGIVRDITLRVNNERWLKKAKEDAEQANLAKSEFLAIVSHEMRTPLNPILGFANILRENTTNPTEKEYLDHIILAANRQLEIIDDILNYTAMDRGTMTANWSDFNLYDTCLYALEDVRPKASHLELDLQFGSDELPISRELEVSGEQTMLLSLLDNLLSNACKYTKQGSVYLKIWQHPLDALTSDFYFSVTDTGIGIPEDLQDAIFEPFTQADSSHKRNYEGIGLGLAICRKLAEFLRGEIRCESRPGMGSTFTFRLPMRVVNPPVAEIDQPPGTTVHLQKKLHVLVVDDRPDNARLMEAILKKLDAKVQTAENGEVAVRLCKQTHYDCILMDLSMPVMSGLDASKEIRKSASNSNTPIIAVTADVAPGVKERCMHAGIDDYLSKPIDPLLLKTKMSEIAACALSNCNP